MSTATNTTKDYRLRDLIPDRVYDPIRRDAIKTQHLQEAGEAFFANMARVDSLSIFPPLVFIQGEEYSTNRGVLRIQYRAIASNTVDSIGIGGEAPNYHRTVDRLGPGMDRIQELSAIPPSMPGIEAWMASLILATWTAFETLASDLWVAALNGNPAGLAELVGSARRIGKLAGEKHKSEPTDRVGGADEGQPAEQSAGDERGKSVSLNDIHQLTHGTYDIRNKMGTLLKGRFNFATLRGIREAYSAAFSENEKKARATGIDEALSHRSLDSMSAVRNLIVHKAGIADAEYVGRTRNGSEAPQLIIGQKLELDGTICKFLVDSTVASSIDLVKAVDSWLTLTAQGSSASAPSNK